MRAIVTRTLPWTNYRPRRIVADAGPGCRRVQPWDRDDERSGDDEARHREAAEELCRVMGWPGRLEGGQLPGGDWAWVFVAVPR